MSSVGRYDTRPRCARCGDVANAVGSTITFALGEGFVLVHLRCLSPETRRIHLRRRTP